MTRLDWASQKAMLAQVRDGCGSILMMDEDSAGLFPELAVLVSVVHQSVTSMAVLALQSRAGGDHLDTGKVATQPSAASAARPKHLVVAR